MSFKIKSRNVIIIIAIKIIIIEAIIILTINKYVSVSELGILDLLNLY